MKLIQLIGLGAVTRVGSLRTAGPAARPHSGRGHLQQVW